MQTPLLGAAGRASCEIGDRVYLRHAKAGELCERFDALHLVEGERDRRRRPDLPRRGQGVPLRGHWRARTPLQGGIEKSKSCA